MRTIRRPRFTTRVRYAEKIRARWEGKARRDAVDNWRIFRAREPELIEWVRLHRRDPLVEINGQCKNPHGTLDALLWIASGLPDNEYMWDWEQHHQCAFLRRGILQYCELLRAQMDWVPPDDPRQLYFDF